MKRRYLVQQSFRGVATFLVEADTAAEALAMVNRGGREHEGVECVDRDVVQIYNASWVRLDKAKSDKKRRRLP